LSLPGYIIQAYILHYFGRNDEALEAVRSALEMNAAHPPASSGRAAYTPRWGSTTKRARRCSGLVRSRSWTPVMAVLSYLHGNGQPAEAQARLAEFKPSPRPGDTRPPTLWAWCTPVSVIASRRSRRWRRRTTSGRTGWWLKCDPRWNEIQSQERFQQLVRDVGLPPQ
jgi:hypothetical protein